MNFIGILLIALSMSMDAFAVCIGAGTTGQANGPRPNFRMAFHFGLFQFIMPTLGWLVGQAVERYLAMFDHWVAFGLLAFVGGRMIWSGFHADREEARNDSSRGWAMVLLSIAVSIDALVIGFSLRLIGVPVWYPAIVIGVVTGLMSLLGLKIGNRLGKRFGHGMEILGGLVLLGIGIRIVMAHLFG